MNPEARNWLTRTESQNRTKLNKFLMAWATCVATVGFAGSAFTKETLPHYPFLIKVIGANQVIVSCQERQDTLRIGQQIGVWNFMGIVQGAKQPIAVFEDFSTNTGHLIFVDAKGIRLDLAKSLEATFASSNSCYLGHSLQEILKSDRDLLAESILAKGTDPRYEEIAACIPPLSKMRVYTFVGTPECFEKVGIFYGGSTPNFDPAAYVPSIRKIRDEGRVFEGLVGGWLPVLRFVYPEGPGDWAELLAYAPMRTNVLNLRVQPVWYRVAQVKKHRLEWVRYFDSYHPFPPRTEPPPGMFYHQLLETHGRWETTLAQAMKFEIPDERLANLTRHSLVRDLITRMGDFPKYGVFERGYGGSEHDGFQDTFNQDTTAMLEWGLLDEARRFIDNYFKYFVREDGSLLYRGPETGQFGRMLTVVAEYAAYTGDTKLLLTHRDKLDGLTKLLLSFRSQAMTLSPTDPAYGMIAGWSEADACLDPDPARYMKPYFSNSSEAARGFRDLGRIWEKVGIKKRDRELAAWGRTLQAHGQELWHDLQVSLERSLLTNTHPYCIPAIAGAKEPFDIAVTRDPLDPQMRSYRAYVEMLYSGNLRTEQVDTIVRYRSSHRDIVLGIPCVYGYNTHEWGGFLSYGHAFGLLQTDRVRDFLLTLYSLSAHHYTRGTWTAPETRNVEPQIFAAPYCTPAQLTVPLLTRWMLLFEDPASDTLWLAKGTPRSWLEAGKTIAIHQAPSKWGRLSYSLKSELQSERIQVRVVVPERQPAGGIKLRLRVPEPYRLRGIKGRGNSWKEFDPREETITLAPTVKGTVEFTAEYSRESTGSQQR